jgi:hypothetical protein
MAVELDVKSFLIQSMAGFIISNIELYFYTRMEVEEHHHQGEYDAKEGEALLCHREAEKFEILNK